MRISDWSSDVCSSDLITLKSLNGTAITAEDLSDVVEGLGELDIISVDDLDGVDINGTTISATNGSVAKLRQLAVMANVTYDIPLGGNTFKPYVGVGLGAVGSHLKALGEDDGSRSEEHTSELQSLMRISYAVFCLKQKKQTYDKERKTQH